MKLKIDISHSNKIPRKVYNQFLELFLSYNVHKKLGYINCTVPETNSVSDMESTRKQLFCFLALV